MTPASTLVRILCLLAPAADASVRRRYAGALATIAAASATAAAAPLALKELIDGVSRFLQGAETNNHHLPSSVLACGALYALALGVARALVEARTLLTGPADQRLCAALRLRFFTHLLGLPLQFHTSRRVGLVTQSVHQAAGGCQLLLITAFTCILPVILEVAGIVVVLIRLGEPELVAVFLASTAAYLGVFTSGSRELRSRSHAVTQAILHSHGILTDHLVNCEAVKCWNAEGHALRRLAKTTRDECEHGSALHRHRAWMGFGAATVFVLSVGTSLWLAGQAVSRGTLSVGGFVLANAYLLQIVRPLESLAAGARDVLQAMEWVRPMLDALDAPLEDAGRNPNPDRKPNSAQAHAGPSPSPSSYFTPVSPAIRFHNVRFAYDPAHIVLNGIDLEVQPGTTLGVVGASGSGKSSLLRLLMRLHEPQCGQIMMDGQPLRDLPIAALRRRMALVPQDTSLFHDTVFANIALGDPEAPAEAVRYAARVARLHDRIMSMPKGYDTVVGERGLMLSGGERQRVAIARAVLRNPGLFLFDEATSMLDSRTEAEILQSLREVSAGCTTIMVAHRLSTLAHADEIAVLDRGRIVERGTHATLMYSDGFYAALWRQQQVDPPLTTQSLDPESIPHV